MKVIQQFNKIFKKETQDFVVINLGNYYLKGLIVRAGQVTDYFIKQKSDLPLALKQIWKEKNISNNKVKLSVKDHSTLVRYFNFPKIDKKKIKLVIS